MGASVIVRWRDLARVQPIGYWGSLTFKWSLTFGIGLTVYTNAGTFPGFAGPTTGYLLAANGGQFGGTQVAGRAEGSDGTFDVGLDSFTSADLNGANLVDISGVHFATSFPNSGFTVADARLRLSLNSSYDAVEFGTAQQLPEPSTMVSTLIGFLAIAVAAGRRPLAQRKPFLLFSFLHRGPLRSGIRK